MLDRLLGQETEYAIRFSPRAEGAGAGAPGNDVVYAAIAASVRSLVETQPPDTGRDLEGVQLFTANGGALYYEVSPLALRGGLVEACTPECRGPSQLLLYQKAEERLLLDALPLARDHLAALGFEGELALLKNCRDAVGHVYGAQESYEVEVARGAGLALYRVGLALLLLLVPLQVALFWVVGFYVYCAVFVWGRLGALLGRSLGRSVALLGAWAELTLRLPLALPYTALLGALAFRGVRREALGFFVSRPILSGAGTLERDGRFGLSEKGPAIRRVTRSFVGTSNRPLFDTGNLLNDLSAVIHLKMAPILRLFRRHQRLQLGLADSNLAQVAEYLKVGTTLLVLDMIESGFLHHAPRPRRPIEALHALIADEALAATVPVVHERSPQVATMSALELQRWYLTQAKAYVAASKVTSLEVHQLVTLWGETLDALDADPGALVGRLDWVTKRWLLATAGRGLPFEAKKKIDLRYHELGGGYFAQLEARGLTAVLVEPSQVREAVRTPPRDSPAAARGRLVRELAGTGAPVTVSWDSVRIGSRTRGQLIRLDDRKN